MFLMAGLAACDAIQPSAPRLTAEEVIPRIEGLLDAGDLPGAKTLTASKPLIEVGQIDPSDPGYCTEAAVKARMSETGYRIAQKLLDHAAEDPVTRYALVSRDVKREIQTQDEMIQFGGSCSTSRGEYMLAYSRARTPMNMAATSAIDHLKERAEAASPRDLNVAVKAALSKAEKSETEDFIAMCKARRSEHAEGPEDPILARAKALLLSNCAQAGT
jgi:hypothetical protein